MKRDMRCMRELDRWAIFCDATDRPVSFFSQSESASRLFLPFCPSSFQVLLPRSDRTLCIQLSKFITIDPSTDTSISQHTVKPYTSPSSSSSASCLLVSTSHRSNLPHGTPTRLRRSPRTSPPGPESSPWHSHRSLSSWRAVTTSCCI